MTLDKTFTVHLPFCPENLSAFDIELLLQDELGVFPDVKEMNKDNAVFIAVRKIQGTTFLFENYALFITDKQELLDLLDMGSLQNEDKIYRAELVSKIVEKPKVIKTSELVLEDVK